MNEQPDARIITMRKAGASIMAITTITKAIITMIMTAPAAIARAKNNFPFILLGLQTRQPGKE